MTHDPDMPAIRRRADGSIDTGHYIARGRGLQGATLRAAFGRLFRGDDSESRRSGQPHRRPDVPSQKT